MHLAEIVEAFESFASIGQPAPVITYQLYFSFHGFAYLLSKNACQEY